MNDRLRRYIDILFEEAPQTKKTVELKEEILQNITDKYNDLLSEGKTEEAAYNIAVASVGEVGELIESLKNSSSERINPSQEEIEKSKQRSALVVSISVAMYIISVIPPIIFGENLGPILMFLIIAIATALLIYNNMTKTKYVKIDDTIVEEFKEWKENRGNRELNAISSAIWSIATVVYIIVSFLTGAWHITWVIFLIATAITSIAKAILDLRGDRH